MASQRRGVSLDIVKSAWVANRRRAGEETDSIGTSDTNGHSSKPWKSKVSARILPFFARISHRLRPLQHQKLETHCYELSVPPESGWTQELTPLEVCQTDGEAVVGGPVSVLHLEQRTDGGLYRTTTTYASQNRTLEEELGPAFENKLALWLAEACTACCCVCGAETLIDQDVEGRAYCSVPCQDVDERLGNDFALQEPPFAGVWVPPRSVEETSLDWNFDHQSEGQLSIGSVQPSEASLATTVKRKRRRGRRAGKNNRRANRNPESVDTKDLGDLREVKEVLAEARGIDVEGMGIRAFDPLPCCNRHYFWLTKMGYATEHRVAPGSWSISMPRLRTALRGIANTVRDVVPVCPQGNNGFGPRMSMKNWQVWFPSDTDFEDFSREFFDQRPFTPALIYDFYLRTIDRLIGLGSDIEPTRALAIQVAEAYIFDSLKSGQTNKLDWLRYFYDDVDAKSKQWVRRAAERLADTVYSPLFAQAYVFMRIRHEYSAMCAVAQRTFLSLNGTPTPSG